MGYRLTHIIHTVRRDLKGTSRGSLKKMLIAMLLAMCSALLVRTFVGYYSDELLQRTLYALRGPRNASPEIILVGIDDETYKSLDISPRHPFPRRVFAEGLAKIHRDKPKVVILDLYAPREKEDPEANAALRNAIASGPTVLVKVQVTQAPISEDANEHSLEYGSDPQFQEVAALEAPLASSLIQGVAYRISVGKNPRAEAKDRIALFESLKRYSGQEIEAPKFNDYINFYGEGGRIRRVSFGDIISGSANVPEGYFLNKIVLVGFQSNLKERARGDKEIIDVPSSDRGMFGVEIHATIASNLLDKTWLRRLPDSPFNVEHFLLVTLSFFLILGIISLRPAQALLYLVVYLGLWYGATYIAFAHYYLFIPGVFLMLAVGPLVLAAAGVLTALSALKELQETKRMLGVEQGLEGTRSGTFSR